MNWKELLNIKKVGSLSSFKFDHKNKYGHVVIKCKCDCGNEVIRRFTQISKAVKEKQICSCGCIQKEKAALSGRANRKFTINDKIYRNSPEKSYIIGLLAADGYNSGKHVEICLQYKDLNILEKIKEFLDYTGEIKLYPQKNKCRLLIAGKDLCQFLLKEGITRTKTKTFSVPEKYRNDKNFWRGYVDGDGCLYKYHYKYDTFGLSLIGTRETIEAFKEFTNSNCKVSKVKSSIVYSLNLNGSKSIPTIKLLYDNSTIYINRKKEKAEEILQYFRNKINAI